MRPGLIIVSNRLPISVKKVDGELEFYPSIGGLATGLASYAGQKKNKWIGWPGLPSDNLTEKERQSIADELQKSNCYPVFLTQKQIDEFYNGYSNSILWPLFHDQEVNKDAKAREHQLWKAYEHVNQRFAEVVQALTSGGDTIWVHDYQLLILPALLRLERPYDRVGFFLHIPFPATDRFTTLSDGETLVAGMLGADLVGLHIEPYVQNFLNTVNHYDSGITEHQKVILQDRVVRVTDFPMGIDYDRYEKARKSRAVMREYAKLKLQYAGQKVILTVDRLDPAKGLVERARAYQTLLRENPKLHGKVVLVMLVVPSRVDIPEYKQLKEELEQVVQETNEEFGILPWIPVEYMFTALPFEQVTALYRRADVAFITPLRDGMNLVAKEYLASKPYQRGVLILSRTAGAAQELKDAILVDPAKPATLVRALTKAINMPRPEFKKRVLRMQKHLAHSTVHTWAKSFTKALNQEIKLPTGSTSTLKDAAQSAIGRAYKQANNRLLLLDYDGVLEPFHRIPERAAPSQELKQLLERLSERAHVVVISGRRKYDLESWFGGLPITLIAEHGLYTRKENLSKWQGSRGSGIKEWYGIVLQILERYATKTPGAFVEKKDASLVWHYRRASPYYAQKNLVALKRVLAPIIRKYSLLIEQGNQIIEVRPQSTDKGSAARAWLKSKPDFVLAIGDDYTDEDMFKALPPTAYTVKVGRGRTAAGYRISNVSEVLKLLKRLSRIS